MRLTQLFGRDFGECNIGGTLVMAPPQPCQTCGKWTEFIDWWVLRYIILYSGSLLIIYSLVRVYTAIQRNVHSADFIFTSLRDRKFPKENTHDVYCSKCGHLTQARSRDNTEGRAADILSAGVSTVVDASIVTDLRAMTLLVTLQEREL